MFMYIFLKALSHTRKFSCVMDTFIIIQMPTSIQTRINYLQAILIICSVLESNPQQGGSSQWPSHSTNSAVFNSNKQLFKRNFYIENLDSVMRPVLRIKKSLYDCLVGSQMQTSIHCLRLLSKQSISSGCSPARFVCNKGPIYFIKGERPIDQPFVFAEKEIQRKMAYRCV